MDKIYSRHAIFTITNHVKCLSLYLTIVNAFMQAFTPALECEALASFLKAVASLRIPKRIKNGEQRG
jgi:hypothetical protein